MMADGNWPSLPMLKEPYSTVVITLAAAYIVPPTLRFVVRTLRTGIRQGIAWTKRGSKSEDVQEKGVVYLYMFHRSCTRQMLNLSPFAIKMETWLRLRKIPYKVIETMKFSSTTKQIPYIKYNGEEVSDTAFIIDYLTEKFQLDPLEGGTVEEQGITRAFHRMADESLALYYFLDKEFFNFFRVSSVKYVSRKIMNGIGKSINERAVAGGLGRHTPGEIGIVGQEDVRAIARFLGSKDFMFGDKPRLVDCIVFAHLTQVFYIDVAFPHKDILNEGECQNLMPYMERMKSLLWSDWDTLVNEEPFPK